MTIVLPGRPRSRPQALCTGRWDGLHLIVYISGNAFTVLCNTDTILQTIYDEDSQPLEAIAFSETTGKIATCTSSEIRVYRPIQGPDGLHKWSLETTPVTFVDVNNVTYSLSWGASDDLLFGGASLALYTSAGEPNCVWRKELPSPSISAKLSYDSSYIASIGQLDGLVKVWRRLTYSADEVRFDLSYLRHPQEVTQVQWRRPLHVEAATDNALYTFCMDARLRIWTPSDTFDGQHWRMWGEIDLRNPSPGALSVSPVWFTFIIDGRDFTASVERAVQDRMPDDPIADDVALDHLVAIAQKAPEICVAMSVNGDLVAWAVEDVGHRTSSQTSIFNIAQVCCPQFQAGGFSPCSPSRDHLMVYTSCDRRTSRLNIFLHSFSGRIGVFTSSLADLFDPTTNEGRLKFESSWTGQSTPITKINRNFSGRAVVARGLDGECTVWQHNSQTQSSPQNAALVHRSTILAAGQINRICVLRKGRFVVLLGTQAVSLWDCRNERATCMAEHAYKINGKPLCLILLPRPDVNAYADAYVATISSEQQGLLWKISLPNYLNSTAREGTGSISDFCHFVLKDSEGLSRVIPVDPAGFSHTTSSSLDIFSRDIALSYTRSGRMSFWTARVEPGKEAASWLCTCQTETSIDNPALVSGSMLKKAAIVNSGRSQLTIWDIGSGRLEFDQDYEALNDIRDLDWTSTPDSQSILAVGFQYRVLLLSQMRFDYLNEGPAWASIREVSILELTPHPIGDSTWLGDGHLVIGAGNQMFVHDRSMVSADALTAINYDVSRGKEPAWDLFEAVRMYNGPLPLFHPQFLSQCFLSGKVSVVRQILVALDETLKFLSPGDAIDNYLGLDIESIYQEPEHGMPKSSRGFDFSSSNAHDSPDSLFTQEVAVRINEKLTRISLPQLSRHEQIQLADIVECASYVEKHRRSMDENGARFLLFFRQHILRKGRAHEIHLSWREISWAYHSESQVILTEFIAQHNRGNMLWEQARQSGVFMWLNDPAMLRRQFEIVARTEYTKSDDKNPVDCSLFYLALRKKTVLQGLWRMATWNKEQRATQRLLANDFNDPKWKTTALKNAYALLSKRRFGYAVAFFLLADRVEDACDVCLRQLKDLQLAIAVCRVYDGDGPVLHKLLQDEVLPLAGRESNRWLASWAFWMLGRRDMAVRSLLTPVDVLLGPTASPSPKSRLFLTDDPALVVLYSQLRQRTLQTLHGAAKISPKAEWDFVLDSAKLYDRMGCDLLGLDLVRNWEFQQPARGKEVDPLKLLRRRSSLVVNDMQATPIRNSLKDKTRHNPHTPSIFSEPDPTSLLDSFGF